MSVDDVRHRVAALRRTVVLLAESRDPDVHAIGFAIARWLDRTPGDRTSLATELGFSPGWRAAHQRAERDRLLGLLAAQHFSGLNGREQAAAIATAASRYAASAWPRDWRAGCRPDGLAGALYDLQTLGGAPGKDRVRQIVAEPSHCCTRRAG